MLLIEKYYQTPQDGFCCSKYEWFNNRMILMIFQSYPEEKAGEVSSEEETVTQRFASVSRDDYIPDSDSEGKIFRDLLHLSLSFNASHAEVTFVQSTRTQIIL